MKLRPTTALCHGRQSQTRRHGISLAQRHGSGGSVAEGPRAGLPVHLVKRGPRKHERHQHRRQDQELVQQKRPSEAPIETDDLRPIRAGLDRQRG